MSAQPTAPATTRRDQVLHWLLWSCELAMAALVVPFLVMMTVMVLPTLDELGTEDAIASRVAIGWAVTAILLSALPAAVILWWLLRGIRLPFGARRLQRGAIAGSILLMLLLSVPVFTIRPDLEAAPVPTLLIIMMFTWACYRLLFMGLLKWTHVDDDRPAAERVRQAKLFSAVLALFVFSAAAEWTFERDRSEDLSPFVVLALLATPFLFYKITTNIAHWRIQRKLGERAAVAEGGTA